MQKISGKTSNRPFLWIPTLYMAEGLPYIIVNVVSVIMFKTLGISNTDIALYTGLLYLPWVIKPFWSPIVDLWRTNRFWVLLMQLFIGAGFACIALTIPLPNFFRYTLAFLWLIAFGSATHDIAADGFYMSALNSHQQALYVGVRSTFYRLAMIVGQGLLVIMAGYIQNHSGLEAYHLHVTAAPVASVVQEIPHPDSVATTSPLPGDLRIIASADTLQIPIVSRSAQQIAAWRQQVDTWNHERGQQHEILANRQQEDSDKPGWWEKQISRPLAAWIRDQFGPKTLQAEIDKNGNLGIIYFQLSAPPPFGKEIVLNFGQESRNPDIRLILGNRFVFTEKNWNQPAGALIQLDPKLKKQTDTDFITRAGNIPLSWVITIGSAAVLFILLWLYHTFILPVPASSQSRSGQSIAGVLKEFKQPFVTFFQKKTIGRSIAFLLLFRLGESQLVKLASPFLLDAREVGGLGLTTGQVGLVYGTIGLIFLTAGGILGGLVAAKFGLRKMLLWMAFAINVPDLVYVYLSHSLTDNFILINLCVSLEQFGYGFGFTAYMLYQIYISRGQFETSHFAITTAFMALGMMLPGMFSGWLQELIGYQHFFIWVLIACLPVFFVIPFLNIDSKFGIRENSEK